MSTRDDLERLVIRNAKLELHAVADDDLLGHEVGLDSQALLSLLLDIEDRFEVEIPQEQVAGLVGIRFADFVTLVEGAVAATHGAAP